MNAILYNCRIYPQYRTHRLPTVLAVSGNTITYVGNDRSEAQALFPRHTLYDLQGRCVVPGFVDSHTHFFYWARTLDAVNLDGCSSFEKALGRIEKHAKKVGAGEWITGYGWSSDRWEEYHLPTAAELDVISWGHPAFLLSKDQHAMWVNSDMLRIAGIDRDTADPNGGKIDRDNRGNPVGILREGPAFELVLRHEPEPTQGKVERGWTRAAEIAYSKGVTGFHSVDSYDGWEYFRSLHDGKKLGFRVCYYFPVDHLEEQIRAKVRSGQGDTTLTIGGVKIFSDGSLGSQTALMKEPYKGNPGNRGVEVLSPRELQRLVRLANGNGLACAIHAIGDQAVANVIDAFEKSGKKGLRNRIEHLQLIARSCLPALKQSGAVASMQPSHCPSDRKLVADYWGKRGKHAYIFRTLEKHGIPLAFGSDCPIEKLDPLSGINAAVNRTGEGERGGKFYPEEALTVARAVHGFTGGAAYASGRENFSGKIAPGFQADLIVLHDDLYSMPRSCLYKARIAATVFDGRMVYQGDSLFS